MRTALPEAPTLPGTTIRPGPAVAVGAVLFAGAVLTYALLNPLHLGKSWSMLDLQIYWLAGIAAAHGQDVYRMHFLGLPFTYTPFSLLVFENGSHLSIDALRWLVTVGGVAALLASLWIAWGMAGVARGWARVGLALGTTGIVLWSEPVLHTLGFGQINLAVMLLVLADLCQPDRRPWKGVGVGLAAAIKLTPGIFIGYLLVTRRFRAAGLAGATFALTVALGFLALPVDSHRFWLGRLFTDSQRVGGVAFTGNQSINGLLVRALGGVAPAVAWWWVAAVAVGAAGLAVAAWASRRGEELLGVVVCALTGLLISPISWSHHWVWIGPGLVVCTHLAHRHRSRLGWGISAGLVVLFAAGLEVVWRVPHSRNREYAWSAWQAVIGNGYVLAGLALLIGAACYLACTAGTRPPELGATEDLATAGVTP